MALNPTPSSTRLPAALPQNPPETKSNKAEMAKARREKAAESREVRKKTKALVQVTTWKWKGVQPKPAAQSSQEDSSSDRLIATPNAVAAQRTSAEPVVNSESPRESFFSTMQFPAVQPSHAPAAALPGVLDRTCQAIGSIEQHILNFHHTQGPVMQTRVVATQHALRTRYEKLPFLLGKGCYANIVLGMDRVSRTYVAIKNHMSTPSAYQAAVCESAILQELERRQVPHRLHIRAAFEVGSTEESKERVIVTDYVPGRNIFENFINPNTRLYSLNPLYILSFGKQLLEYLSALSPDVVHGDLAPVNLIYEMDCNHLTVLDNGLSRRVNDKTTQLIQSSFYRCPEAILKGPIDCSADIWSVGCILFELFTGQPLFPVYDNKEDFTISSNELLQRMSYQIGMPEKQFLEKCADASKYYFMKKSQVHFQGDLPITDIQWREAILAAAPHRGMPLDAAHEFIHLLEGMLRYENRLSTSELLRSPLFQMGTSFHLGPTFISGDIITIYHASDMHRHLENKNPMAIQFPSPVFHLNNSQVTRTCFHIRLRDPEDQYIVYLTRQGLSYPGQRWLLKDGQTLEFVFPPIAEEPSAAEAL